jgi:hypothetical protein
MSAILPDHAAFARNPVSDGTDYSYIHAYGQSAVGTYDAVVRDAMRIGIPTWNGRVSPVLDAAERMVVIETPGESAPSRREVALDPRSVATQAARISELSLDTLVCGAVSRVLADLLASAGLAMVPWVAGDLEDVLAALEADDLGSGSYAMPGCCRRRGRARHGGRMQSQMGRRARRSG